MSTPLVNQALEALKAEDFATARDCIAAFAKTHALTLPHYLIKGLAELSLQEWGAASLTFAAAIEKHPREPQLWNNLGLAQENLGHHKKAAECYEESLRLAPDQPETCGNLSNTLCQTGRFAEAEHMARRALQLGAPRADALNILGRALMKQNRAAEAEAVFREALSLAPQNALILSNLANIAVDRLDFPTALALFAEARAAEDLPAIRHFEGMARLQSGDFERGWALYESRLEIPGALRVQPTCPLWRGENLRGKKLLLISEQGFGDTLQFCRHGKFLEQGGAEILWVVQKPLVKLLAANFPAAFSTESDPLPDADFYLPLLSLPRALKIFRPEDSAAPPYLRAPHTSPALPPSDKTRKIGLCWTGSPTNERDYEKAIPFETLTPLLALPDVQFYAPFLNPRLAQVADTRIIRLDHLIGDFTDTAALLAQFDAVISVDTAVAHLAGAMGLKTFVLLAYCPDWRWGVRGESSPWYPSATLIRQPAPGDWNAVIAQVAEKFVRL